MSNINKQELREAAERAESDSWGYDRDEFNEALTPSTVLALLDELEAKDSMIAAQQHEIRTLLNALEGRPCPKCNDTGMADSGGTQPWGEPISVPCDCAAPPSPVSVPEILPCPVLIEPGMRFGKGVRTQTMLDALQRRANYYAELEAMTPEQRAEHDAGMKEFAAMLQGADGNTGKPLTMTLPDISSKAFWSGTGKNETFHPETYRRWVKEAIERSCTIARVDVEVK